MIFEFSSATWAAPLWAGRTGGRRQRSCARQRTDAGPGPARRCTRKAGTLARFYGFLLAALPGPHPHADRPRRHPGRSMSTTARTTPDYGEMRVPPAEDEVDELFDGLARRACRTRASTCPRRGITWRRRCGGRAGLRITRDATCSMSGTGGRDLGEFGKIHVRFGKGSTRPRRRRPGWSRRSTQVGSTCWTGG